MNTIFLFEAKRTIRRWPTLLFAITLTGIGIFCGNRFNLSVGDRIFLNSPYTIGFMIGLLSLSIIFFAIIFAGQQLFKDWDSKFDLIIFSFPLSKQSYVTGRFVFYFLQTFMSFILLVSGFVIGQNMRTGSEIQPYFNAIYYSYPVLIFGFFNCILVCSFLFFVSLITKKKLLVVVGGLLLYVLYMVVLLFSNSPFMAGSLPQSAEAQQLSAILDPFGISAYFLEAKELSAHQKNNSLVQFYGYLLINRIIFFVISLVFLLLSYRLFSMTVRNKKTSKRNDAVTMNRKSDVSGYEVAQVDWDYIATFKSVVSFAKIDLIYLFKSITITAVSILLLFCVGMEMYAEIEKGIRLPQKYAGSGLMATTISENFHILGLLIMAYFINDLYWRSHVSGFSLIEKSTFFSGQKRNGHLVSSGILLFFFTGILVFEGMLFQIAYGYFHIDWIAYSGTVIFNTLPLILFSAFILLLNSYINNRFIALGASVLAAFILAGPASQKVIAYPLLRIFSDFRGTYSDFNGYGVYMTAFLKRLLFGLGVMATLWAITARLQTKRWNIQQSIFALILLTTGIFSGISFMKGYQPENEDEVNLQAIHYERQYKHYEQLPQPTITDVITEIHLFPSGNAYTIKGKYLLKNNSDQPVYKILVSFHPDIKIEHAVFKDSSGSQEINTQTAEVRLKKPLQTNETAVLDFTLSYHWLAINGHRSFNAIIENGSFMRISRYYPVIGYQKELETEDKKIRKDFKLGEASPLKSPEAPAVSEKDFINLKMKIFTEKGQTAVGTGDIIRQWTTNKRSYFEYSASRIPFRFAVSSAQYVRKTICYRGITINIFYHQKHKENVEHLIKNTRITLDYCILNFGKYPFKTINFAEISSFTKGFAATAYPSSIFMPEDMVFHANIHADQGQDVINELAGHELSHLWWGNSQIDPDDREGSAMLTETLAMYTEMMLYKKMHGKNKMMERIKMHQQIYDNEKGLSEDQPVYKVTGDHPHISYSKGAAAMIQLSELVGEQKVNTALKNFLHNNQYPKKPTSLDLLKEFYKISPDASVHKKIDRLFKAI